MSSAAVLAVYTAGYVRTRPAANRLAYESFMERAAPQQTQRDVDVAPATLTAPPAPAQPQGRPTAARVPAVSEAAPNVTLPAASAKTQPTATQPAPAEPATSVTAPVSTTSPAAAPAAAEAKVGPNASASAPVAQTTPAAASDPAAATQPAVATAPATQTPPPAPAPPVWKDGKYTAWGTCRHGDIEATVVIEGGHIISAEITNCQTRYACDVIENLPAKVITRQKAKFDVVGGATESAYAYYGAVYWALDQASK